MSSSILTDGKKTIVDSMWAPVIVCSYSFGWFFFLVSSTFLISMLYYHSAEDLRILGRCPELPLSVVFSRTLFCELNHFALLGLQAPSPQYKACRLYPVSSHLSMVDRFSPEKLMKILSTHICFRQKNKFLLFSPELKWCPSF